MTSSEKTSLAPGTIDAAAAQVGTCYAGDPDRGGGRARFAIVCSKFNGAVTERLLGGAIEAFKVQGIDQASVTLAWVPGAFELPLVAQRFAVSGEVDAVVVLGAIIRGETPHFDYVAGECAAGCQQVALSTGVPIVFGVLTTEDVEQALGRSAPGTENRGYQAALTALEMCDLLGKLPAMPARVV
jgi:6,7-dimethyl-8-ribityllumazine synthase